MADRWSYTSEDCGEVVWYELHDNGKPTGLTMDFTDKSQDLLEQIVAALNAAQQMRVVERKLASYAGIIAAIANSAADAERERANIESRVSRLLGNTPPDDEGDELIDIGFVLSARAIKSVQRYQYRQQMEITDQVKRSLIRDLTDGEILRLPNTGQVTLAELRRVFGRRGED